MSEGTTEKRSNLFVPVALILLGVVGFGAVWLSQQNRSQTVTSQTVPEASQLQDANSPVSDAETETALLQDQPAQQTEQAQPADDSTNNVAQGAQATELDTPIDTAENPVQPLGKPSFDYVRVENGIAVIAGRSERGAVVDILGNGQTLNQAEVDGNGAFATVVMMPETGEPIELSMLAIRGDQQTASTDTYLVLPREGSDQLTVVELNDQGVATILGPIEETPVVDQSTVEGLQLETSQTALPTLVPQKTEPAVSQSIDVAIASLTPDTTEQPLVDNEQAIRLVAPTAVTDLTLDTINYGTEGEVVLTGRGRADQAVRVYVDNKPISLGSIEDGQWRLTLPDVDEGIYTIRVDAVDSQGAVTARVESPFKRETPDLIAVAGAPVTIQPGFTLWQLAEQSYGNGNKFVQIFEANRERIRDPNLIYPGQVFEIPE